jgi:hypothetical protein
MAAALFFGFWLCNAKRFEGLSTTAGITMFTNGNLAAPISIFSFLGAGLMILVIGLGLVYSVLKKRRTLGKIAVFSIAGIAALYLAVLLLFSFNSHEQLLARGQEKYFCEIDCHLAYSVSDVREVKTLGDAPSQISTAGMLRVVMIKTRFDENTIGANRGNGLLYPNPRVVAVVDERGNEYFPSAEGQRILEGAGAAGSPMTTPLRPGEAYTTTLVFDLPADTKTPTLLIQERDFVTHLLIGHENSPLHKKTRFQI